MHRTAPVLITLCLATGCASVPPSQVANAAGTVAAMAVAVTPAAPAAPLVQLLGHFGSMLIQRKEDQVTETRERRELAEQMAGSGSILQGDPLAGEPVRVWVDETLKDGRILPGRFEVRYVP